MKLEKCPKCSMVSVARVPLPKGEKEIYTLVCMNPDCHFIQELPDEICEDRGSMIAGVNDIARIACDVLTRQKQSKAPIQLTEEERFAIAVSNGIRFHVEIEGESLRATTEPCGVTWTGEKFLVVARMRGMEAA